MELDLRSLATFRVLFSAVLILDCLTRWYDATAHYSDLGLLPRAVLLESGWHADFVSIHMMNGEPWFVHCLFAVQVALALKKQDLFLEGEPVRTAVLRAM